MFQQPIKNFTINFNCPNQRAFFSSGDVITGHMCFDLTKETKITSITMKVSGGVHVHWSTGGGKKSRRRHFSAKVDFFNFKTSIMQEQAAVGEAAKLRPGTHMYPFTCQLPHGDFPSSYRGAVGKVLYCLTVGIDRPWHLTKNFVTELNFVSHIDMNQPELWAPLSGTNDMTLCCLWCASGPISMRVTSEKKAFNPGETVKLIFDISNNSSRIATPRVKLQQKEIGYTHSKSSHRKVLKSLASVTGEPISAHAADVHTEIMLPIPPSAPLSISNCSILDVDYIIQVNLGVTASPDLTVLFPIILYGTPVNTGPPQCASSVLSG